MTKLVWLIIVAGVMAGSRTMAQSETRTIEATYSPAKGIGAETGVMRRDPSDIIKVGDLYYVWYSKGTISSGYDATVWYATSPDGHAWTEKGMALDKGKAGTGKVPVSSHRTFSSLRVGTGCSTPGHRKTLARDLILIRKSASPYRIRPMDPWKRLDSNPVLKNSDNLNDFDSHLIDDACLIVRDGKYWFYYKGRQLGKSPAQTKMGVAIADKPQGPYVKYKDNPIIQGNHEVLVWPQGAGVAAMIGTTGPKEITSSILYAEDGLHFSKTHEVIDVPTAGGAYRPEAFTGSGTGKQIQWGVHIGKRKGSLPFIERFDLAKSEPDSNEKQ